MGVLLQRALHLIVNLLIVAFVALLAVASHSGDALVHHASPSRSDRSE